MHPTINTCYLLLFCWLCAVRVTAQFPQPAFRHYTPDQGLPSSECYDLIQDNEGYIWISTDNGVSRFNGYEFENFGPEQGLKNNVVLYMQEDHQGRIWMMTLAGNAFFYEKDSIKPYRYNHFLQKEKKGERITDFYIDSSGIFYGAFYRNGFIKINEKGHVQGHGDSIICRIGIYPVGKKKVLFSSFNTCFTIDGEKTRNNLVFIDGGNNQGMELVHNYFPTINTPDHPAFQSQEGILFSRAYEMLFFQHESLTWKVPFPLIPNCW